MIKKCLNCLVEYKSKPSINKKFCSRHCYFEGKRKGLIIINKDFYKNPLFLERQRISQLKYYKLHPEKRLLISKKMSGVNSPRWKGGITAERMRIYNSLEWKNWRRMVFVRDDWTCQKCGKRSSKKQYVRIEAHHIKPFSLYYDLRFDIKNGLTLCKECHSKEPKGWEVKI